jgi:hypothetical protein
VEHLLQSVIRAKVEKAPTKTKCETCSVSKATAIVSHYLSVRPTRLYKWVAFDLVHITRAYNDDWIFLHLLYLHTWMNYVYSLSNKE